MKKALSRALSLVLSAVMALTFAVTAFADGYDVSFPVRVNGSVTGVKDPDEDTVIDSLSFSYDWLTGADNTLYNRELALFCNFLSVDAYSDSYVIRDGCEKEYSPTLLMSEIGLSNVVHSDVYDDRGNVATSFSAGSRFVWSGRDSVNVVIVSVDGTDGESQWISNFEVGDSEDVFESMEGERPLWKNRKNHCGFDEASNALKPEIDRYIRESAVKGAPVVLLITGHSRGGAIANILGAVYEDDPFVKSFTYGFSVPTTTTAPESETASYRTVFSIINTNDFFTVMPLPQWGFRRYGRDITIENDAGDGEFKELFGELTGNSKFKYPDLESMLEAFCGFAGSRDEIYVEKTYVETFTDQMYDDWETSELANILYEGNYDPNAFERIGVDGYFSIETQTDTETGVHTITVKYSGIVMMKALSILMANRGMDSDEEEERAEDAFTVLAFASFADEAYYNVFFTILSNALRDLLNNPHETFSSYAVAYLSESDPVPDRERNGSDVRGPVVIDIPGRSAEECEEETNPDTGAPSYLF